MGTLDRETMEHVRRAVEADVATAGSEYTVSLTERAGRAEIHVRFFAGLSYLPLRADDPEWLDELAQAISWLQDTIIEELWGAWPPCPSHPHPMVIRAADGDLEWCCPQTGERRAFLGELRAGA
jgi:hypothetical protein